MNKRFRSDKTITGKLVSINPAFDFFDYGAVIKSEARENYKGEKAFNY